jgi:hypothetical protein
VLLHVLYLFVGLCIAFSIDTGISIISFSDGVAVYSAFVLLLVFVLMLLLVLLFMLPLAPMLVCMLILMLMFIFRHCNNHNISL